MKPANHIASLEHSYKRDKIKIFFPLLNDIENLPLSLYSYIHEIPYRFYSRKVLYTYYTFLETMLSEAPEMLSGILKESSEKLDTAFQALEEINSQRMHDELIKRSYDKALFINNQVHHNYLKLCEGVYSNLIFIPALAFRRKEGRGESGLNVFNRAEELKNTELDYLGNLYNKIIRNAVGHGNITIKDDDIIYADRNGSVTLSFDQVIRHFDDTVDACNGMALALIIFIILNQQDFADKRIKLPKAFLLRELMLQIRTPKWEIITCLDSESAVAPKQLAIYTYNKFLSAEQLQISVMLTAITTEFYAPDYDRYFFHLDSKHLSLGWAGFNGEALRKLRLEESDDFADYYNQALENQMIMYTPLPKYKDIFLSKFIMRKARFLMILRVVFRYGMKAFRENRQSFLLYHRVHSFHRNKLRFIINGSRMVLYVKEGIDIKEYVRTNYKKLVRASIKESKKQCSFFSLAKYVKTDYVSVGIFTEDMRQRELRYPKQSEKLLCTIELNVSKIAKTVDLWFATKETLGRYIIFWNNNYDSEVLTE